MPLKRKGKGKGRGRTDVEGAEQVACSNDEPALMFPVSADDTANKETLGTQRLRITEERLEEMKWLDKETQKMWAEVQENTKEMIKVMDPLPERLKKKCKSEFWVLPKKVLAMPLGEYCRKFGEDYGAMMAKLVLENPQTAVEGDEEDDDGPRTAVKPRAFPSQVEHTPSNTSDRGANKVGRRPLRSATRDQTLRSGMANRNLRSAARAPPFPQFLASAARRKGGAGGEDPAEKQLHPAMMAQHSPLRQELLRDDEIETPSLSTRNTRLRGCEEDSPMQTLGGMGVDDGHTGARVGAGAGAQEGVEEPASREERVEGGEEEDDPTEFIRKFKEMKLKMRQGRLVLSQAQREELEAIDRL